MVFVVGIDGIVDHHCLDYLLIILKENFAITYD